ncbi:MAG: rod shape-determining protein RodA [Patescibacteria group bacterium]|jgi:rod shape determining protein RodA
MLKRIFVWLEYYDWYLIINISLLMIFGLATLYSLQLNVDVPNFTIFNHQLTLALFGLAIFLLVSSINFKVWSDYYKIIYLIALALLILVLAVGSHIRGTTGWLYFFGQGFQPVELVKIALIIFLARFFALGNYQNNLLKGLIVSGFGVLLLIVLVLLQPDFGSSMLLFATWLAMYFLLPVKRKTIVGLFLILLVLASAFWLFFLQDYQQKRLLTFLNPQADPLGSGYNVRQAIVAVGSGSFIGRGLGLGSQSQLNFLPEQQTDFIFAVIAEELGFIGAGLVLVLFFSLLYRIYAIAKLAKDNFAHFFALGLVITLAIQIFVNIGMNLGMAPVTGVPLPLISYGGSSLISLLIALGIIHNIHIRNKRSLFARY